MAQIDAPSVGSMVISLFHPEIRELSELAKFIRHADNLSLVYQAGVTFKSYSISVTISRELQNVGPKTLILKLACSKKDLQLSYLAHFCASCLPTLLPFESLHILIPPTPVEPLRILIPYEWQGVIDNLEAQWLELLHPFNTVKNLRLCETLALCVSPALRGLPAEQSTGVLPALENVFIPMLWPFGPAMEAISEFANAQQLFGCPVFIHNWEGPMERSMIDRYFLL